jgi:ABC-type branched-subunit amino acid transport system ATPase component
VSGDVVAPARGPALALEGLTVDFGGLRAVDGLDLSAEPGAITGLIGPNGAGKTTTFNACCGFVRPTAGRVLLHGEDVSRLDVAARARLGLGRTFQRMELFGSMTVRENVELGRESAEAGRNPWRQLRPSRRERDVARRAAADALARCGIGELAERSIASLSTGQRRLVELARVVAGRFTVLLLDEPSSGLDERETAAFGALLQELVAERGMAVLLVEHDLPLVLGICERIHVVDFGRLLLAGAPEEVRASEVVRAAYLGADAGVGG